MFDSIVTAAAALRGETATASSLVDASLEAIRQHNPSTNAFVVVDEAGARAEANAVDAERARGVDRGPLHGIPVSLKDLIDVAGVVTTAGSKVLDDRVAPADAAIVTRLRTAGAIVIGRTNLHQFALGTTSDDSAFGPVRHPLDAARVAGGSSGGSAVAVATGMGLASVGTDTGGSVRIPAAACGVVGLKPSHGDVPTAGVFPLSPTLDHVGPIARTVQDAAWLFQTISGRAVRSLTRRSVSRLRIRRLDGYFDAMLESEVRDAYEAALDRLASAGITILRGEIPRPERIADAYLAIVLPEAAQVHAPYFESRAALYSPRVHARILTGHDVSAITYLQARDTCRVLRKAVDEALDGGDALVLPTLPILAPRLGQTDMRDPRTGDTVTVRAAMLKHTQLFNMTGHPAISLPIPAGGLPVGLQLVGGLDATEDLLDVASACEPIVGADRT